MALVSRNDLLDAWRRLLLDTPGNLVQTCEDRIGGAPDWAKTAEPLRSYAEVMVRSSTQEAPAIGRVARRTLTVQVDIWTPWQYDRPNTQVYFNDLVDAVQLWVMNNRQMQRYLAGVEDIKLPQTPQKDFEAFTAPSLQHVQTCHHVRLVAPTVCLFEYEVLR